MLVRDLGVCGMFGKFRVHEKDYLSRLNPILHNHILRKYKKNIADYTIRCGHVVRDFESEAKTRCNFQFR